MSEFSRETLLNIIETDHVQCGEASALARMALAELDSEPVAWDYEWASYITWEGPQNFNRVIQHEAPSEWAVEEGRARNIIPLYRHAQPAPVVPDELLKEYLRLVDCMLSDYRNSNYGDAQRWIGHIVETSDAFEEKHGLSPWEMARKNCRAAMLAAAPQSPGSEPATVPGKWISVSEQMPEVGDIVLTAMGGVVNVGETECSAANCRFFTSVISGRELPATHWMQLPAAPQEVGDA